MPGGYAVSGQIRVVMLLPFSQSKRDGLDIDRGSSEPTLFHSQMATSDEKIHFTLAWKPP